MAVTRTKSKPARAHPSDEMSIGAVSKQVGLPPATINFYVNAGVIPAPRKMSRTRAAYSTRHVRVLRLVRAMQGNGLSLASMKKLFDHYGFTDAGITKIEGIGTLQPLPPTPIDPDRRPIEHFDPIARTEFLKRLGRSDAATIVGLLESNGVLRPKQRRYDARDLWIVRTVFAQLDDGVSIDDVLAFAAIEPVMQRLAPVLLRTAFRHRKEMRARTLRMRDLYEPYFGIVGYLIDRHMHELDRTWRERLFG